ncbi:MAG TPA: methyltransferase domain-containing protein [Elusimicrobiota bacterium]|nr:methyltransferase domain-containing protein [Elusimicrobiota bacterium]
MKRDLLSYLRCPDCGAKLVLADARECDGQITDGFLSCGICAAQYPIRAGIPRFLPPNLESGKADTAKRFGAEWRLFSLLNDSYEKGLIKDFLFPLTLDIFKGASVVEIGCGAGRHLLQAARSGACPVIGVDLSSSVEVAYERTRDVPNIHIVQADGCRLPLCRDFDLIFSIGVLHHMPEPRKGFETSSVHTRSGGIVTHTVYGKENNEWIERYVNPIRSRVTSRLPAWALYPLSLGMAILLYPALRLLYRPANEWSFLKPLSTRLFYNDFLYWLAKLGFRVTWLQIYDQLTAPIAHLIPRDEIEQWFQAGALTNTRLHWRNRNCWNFSGVVRHADNSAQK